MESGTLIVQVGMDNFTVPVKGANVTIKDGSGQILYTQITDASGLTAPVALFAPDRSHTFNPGYHGVYYATYQVEVRAPGLTTEIIRGVQIFDGEEAVQTVNMIPALESEPSENVIEIPPHEQVLQTARDPQAAALILPQPAPRRPSPARRVIIPDFITVHLGRFNVPARNVRVPFPHYVKNVASSEIFPTWPQASLEANIRAIINFALNRVYTEWYRGRGLPFDITNSTATDQYFIEGRDIFTSISVIADRVLGEYLRRPRHNEPFFTEYCSGRGITCPGMSQWGTVTLAGNGMDALQILRYYYPEDLSVFTAPIASITESYPGVPLTPGSQGPDVEIMQQYLNRIRQNFPAIPAIANPNGIYGADTANAVKAFQQVFTMPQTGIIDRATWNRIFFLFVSVSKLAELTSQGDRIVTGSTPPNVIIRMGSSGGLVTRLQFMLTYIAQFYPEIPELFQDGLFGPNTRDAVIMFQRRFGLAADGIVGPVTWAKLYEVYYGIDAAVPEPPGTPPPFPGTLLRQGSRGEDVRVLQTHINRLAGANPSVPRLAVDGIFGPLTRNAVIAAQRLLGLAPDGIAGPLTWAAVVR